MAAMTLTKKEGMDGATAVLKELIKDPVNAGDSIKESMKRPEPPIMMTPEEGFAHLLLTSQTKTQWKMERASQEKRRALTYPSYNKVLEVKKNCAPEDVWVAEDGSEALISMQSNLNHQMPRLFLANPELKTRLQTIKGLQPNVRFKMYVKAGADGSTGHGQYQCKGIYTLLFYALSLFSDLKPYF